MLEALETGVSRCDFEPFLSEIALSILHNLYKNLLRIKVVVCFVLYYSSMHEFGMDV